MVDKVDANGRIAVFDIKVPLVLALGLYERLSDQQLREHLDDLKAEQRRRENA